MVTIQIQGWLLSTFQWPKFIILAWEFNHSRIDCTGFDALGQFRKITISDAEFQTAKHGLFDLTSV